MYGHTGIFQVLTLTTRKRLAAPLYWLAGVFLTWANRVDGPQPRKRKGLEALPALLDKYDALLDKLKD